MKYSLITVYSLKQKKLIYNKVNDLIRILRGGRKKMSFTVESRKCLHTAEIKICGSWYINRNFLLNYAIFTIIRCFIEIMDE